MSVRVLRHVSFAVVCGILIALVAGQVMGGSDGGRPAPPQTELGRKLAARQAPNLETLVARSVSEDAETADGALLDILKLREVGDAKAVPVLEKILATPANDSRAGRRPYGGTWFWGVNVSTHACAAAQALFCIGTTEAHEALRTHVLTSAFSAENAVDWTLEYEMPEPARGRFIEQYCLKNLSDDLAIELTVKWLDKDEQRMEFTITARNMTDKPLDIVAAHPGRKWVLYFHSENGVARQVIYEFFEMASGPDVVELPPGEAYRETNRVSVWRIRESYRESCPELSPDSTLVAHDGYGYFHDIGGPGTFEVYALVEAPPLNDEQREKLGMDNAWSGRVVSKPLTIEIAEPAE